MTRQDLLRLFVLRLYRARAWWSLLHRDSVRQKLEGLPGFESFYRMGRRIHPFDLVHGTDTGGHVPPAKLPASQLTSEVTHAYWGSEPSVVRRSLALLPAPETFTFLDLGCGKGRPLLVASEFPFRAIIGVELSPELVETGRKNAARLARQFPMRSRIRLEVGDAGAFPLPAGNLVVFLYNPFGEAIMQRVVASIEGALAVGSRQVFVVYYNPVFGTLFDASPVLRRYFAANVTHAPEEGGFGPDATDAVVIWQGGGTAQPHPGCNAPLVVVRPDHRVEVEG